MTNKTVIRKKNEVGKFTTMHHSILLDTRLSSTAFRLLTIILSDSDTQFKLSQTLYCNRLDITKPTFFSAIDNLEETGYLRKTEIDPENKKKTKKKLYHYTISEFGNLNPKEEVVELQIEKNETSQESKQFQKDEINESIDTNEVIHESPKLELEINADTMIYLTSIGKLLEFDEISDSIMIMVKNQSSVEEIKKWVKKYLVCIYNEKFYSISNSEEYPKAFAEFKTWLKNEVFENYNLEVNVLSKWAKLSKIKHAKKFTTDFETKMSDFYENPRD